MHRRQPGDGGVPGGAQGGREPGRQRGLDPAPRHRVMRLPQYCQVSQGKIYSYLTICEANS